MSLCSAFTGVSIGNAGFLAGQRVSSTPSSAPVSQIPKVIEAAHKKGSGSTKNGRDSNAQRRGVKIYGMQSVKAGGIIVRQLGTKFHPGKNVGMGKDYTIFSKLDGIVMFENCYKRGQKISVYARDDPIITQKKQENDAKALEGTKLAAA
ncbi:hypothetical protein BSKO_06532 [Bryopsis sp. KO-2023]|nr:hypothetical protein BSKO_06532 [Bryopsis sp. KO-2023]